MELIYANENRLALGQLSSFDIDFDATGEKNFELIIDEALLKKGNWIFIPDTEIGGIIDSIAVNTSDRSVKYTGRNFRGILNDKIITVPTNQNRVSVRGKISDVINSLLTAAGLSSCFYCLPSNVEDVNSFVSYSFEPFCTLYEGIMNLAKSINFKIIFSYNVNENRVELTPMLSVNYTDFLTYTNDSAVDLQIEDNSVSINHFILIGYDDNHRYRIDLFVNENSQLMDYASTKPPLKDADYILDNRNQVYFGIDEKAKVYITDRISAVENYELVEVKPGDWNIGYSDKYYYQEFTINGISYKNFETVTEYQQLVSEPSDWSLNYPSYFYYDGEYKNIEGVTTTEVEYSRLTSVPSDWNTNYKNYFWRETDGVTENYVSVSGNTIPYFEIQKEQPSDWKDNFNNYWYVDVVNGVSSYFPAGEYYVDGYKNTKIKNQAYGENFKEVYKVKKTRSKAPKWKPNKYYTQYEREVCPTFAARDVYTKIETTSTSAPSFASGTYYRQIQTAPPFSRCYQKVVDHYAEMISKLLENLEIYPINKQGISITDFEADIGDVVGGYDEKTNITMSAPILNIIYRIERGIQRSIEYVIGG